MGAAIVGALFGPVLGGIASVTGTGPAFASVAVLASVLGVAAWRTPASTPEHPQPLSRLFGRFGTGRSSRRSGSCWCLRSSSAY